MSVISYQFNQACKANPELLSCKLTVGLGSVLVLILALLFPFAVYGLLKQERFKSGDWSKKLAFVSILLCGGIMIFGLSLQVLNYLPETSPVVLYSFYSLIGVIPFIIKHPGVLASIYPKEASEIKNSKKSEKIVMIVCGIILLVSVILIALNYN
ncbi:MAG: hypothetical protein WC069_01820 [Candidatus Shapirobacteria bacterium]